jgi:hypothetical protein
MNTATALILIGVLIVVAIGVWYFLMERRSRGLRTRFGPEYERAVHDYGDRSRAENALLERQRRREKIEVHSLTPAQREKFYDQWRQVQARFVDDPAGSIQEADQVVCDVMKTRGYPMSEFESRAEDLSVDYPHVVRNYRLAHDIAMRHEKGQATTEDLRKALVYYRDLFDELLEAHVAGTHEVRR